VKGTFILIAATIKAMEAKRLRMVWLGSSFLRAARLFGSGREF
jgi:hypothetical protein